MKIKYITKIELENKFRNVFSKVIKYFEVDYGHKSQISITKTKLNIATG